MWVTIAATVKRGLARRASRNHALGDVSPVIGSCFNRNKED